MRQGAVRRQGDDLVVGAVVGEQIHRIAGHIRVDEARFVAVIDQRCLPGVQIIFVDVRSGKVPLVIKGRQVFIDYALRIAVVQPVERVCFNSFGAGLDCRFGGAFRRLRRRSCGCLLYTSDAADE